MIRVLQVLPTLNRGGLETFVMNVYRSIDRKKIQFDFLTNEKDGDYANEIQELGGTIYYIPPRNKGMRAYCHHLNSFFKQKKNIYQAVHYHESSLTSLEVLYYAKKYGIPNRIMHSHSSSILGNKLHYLTHYFGKLVIGSLANHYVGCSDKALDWMFGHTGVRDKAIIVNNGIDVPSFAFDASIRQNIRNRLNISDKDIVVGHIGRFSTVKNHTFLIDIFTELRRITPNAKLVLVGVGELVDSIKSKVMELNLSDSVLFLGLRTDTNNIYQAMDIFVMPSLYEGLPVVLVEAQASGLPVLCSDTISTMSKMSENYETMSIEENAKKWAKRIIELQNPVYNRSIGTRNIIKAGFDINKVADYLSTIYSN